MSVSSAVAQQQENRPLKLGQLIANLRPEIARALPKGLDADRMARLALTIIRKDRLARNGKPGGLDDCTAESFAGALLTSAALGLEPGVNGEAWLVPYKGECTFIPGYQGLVKLFWQHPLALHIDAQAVRAGDEFDYAYGLDPYLRHKPGRGDRGPITDYYACAKLTTGASAFVVLSPEEVRALRGGKEGPSGQIADPQHWMEKKTVLRQLLKLLPKTTNLNRALDSDERPGRELHATMVAERRMIEAPPQQVAPAPAGVNQATGEADDTYRDDNFTDQPAADPAPEEPWR